ncbi:UpxY family transcription antiterminator [Lutibacter sp. B1]|uniref:UpxY family transcription antiterminator n=1 Tax=Lutibacter sp. B1 TaxID=2725996 RepID=UPI0014572A58|nr:UpxY family transcription antiterminator [Lutibacter sp. B1]NLP59247.1 UpxY family transcription antiterminator [Lutibacter sp. B1]
MEGESKWYAIYTHSRAEKKVFERLKVAGYEAFLPLITTIKQWSDRKKKVEVPLINSFVFVNTNNDKLNKTLSIPGVVTVLKYLGKPAVVRNEEIENLKILVNSNEDFQKIESINLEKGEDIVVTKGPFMGLFAKYIQCSGKHKVIVEVEAIKSFFEVTIPLSHISKINS